MDVSQRARLEKLLGMLGSSFDGERANAARFISEMAAQNKMTIPEMIFGPSSSQRSSSYQSKPEDKPKSEYKKKAASQILDALHNIVSSEAELEFTITEWEFQFASDVSEKYDQDYELTEKQLKVATRIIEKVEKYRRQKAS